MKGLGVQGITITAIGGGGFTHETHSMLDDFCLRQAGKTKPRLGFIGTASNDDPLRSRVFTPVLQVKPLAMFTYR